MSTPTVLRSRIAGLTRLAERDLYALWRQVTTAAQARVALNDVLPALIDTYGQAAALVAAEWYDDARDKADMKGRFRAIPAVVPDAGAPGLVAWAESEAKDLDTMLPLILGGVTKRIANAGRGTVIGSSVADPVADGWQRLASPGSCGFCRMLAGRGAVYREETVNFGAHDNCLCQSAPAFKGQPRPVDAFRASEKRRSDETRAADNARARKWIAEHL